jgi:hypothetical protein
MQASKLPEADDGGPREKLSKRASKLIRKEVPRPTSMTY